MMRVGLPEMAIILLIVILIFGANRLPQLGRGIGSAIKNFKEGIKDETADHKS
ncbi:MAG: twin-arginine translocase TatA/TatE family subunit [Blastocatellia bacterium]|nr:MAG: twin-arginine translocase TatA/TatE family subunit [Blastocatellia bacterium]